MKTISRCIGFGKISKAIFFILFLSAGLFVSNANAQTLTTDQGDYAPGSTATITGSGFWANEVVMLQVHHADGTPDTGADHDPWYVTADANGNFVTTWHVCTDDCVGSTLRASADGQSSSLHAEVLFTDNNFSTIDFHQASNQDHGCNTLPGYPTCTAVACTTSVPISWI